LSIARGWNAAHAPTHTPEVIAALAVMIARIARGAAPNKTSAGPVWLDILYDKKIRSDLQKSPVNCIYVERERMLQRSLTEVRLRTVS
jgi:hypothetical protein